MRIVDVNNQKTKALPAAAATAYTDSINLGTVIPGPIGSGLELQILCPAVPDLVDAKTITYYLQDSADDSTFANVVGVGNIVQTGAGGVGAAAVTVRLYLPPGIRQYIRVSAAVLTAGGSNIAKSFTLQLVI